MPQLNTSTSVVDYLKSQGKDSSFTARGKLFKESGMEDRLGPFVGSASQNTALLKNLQLPPPDLPIGATSTNPTTGQAFANVGQGTQQMGTIPPVVKTAQGVPQPLATPSGFIPGVSKAPPEPAKTTQAQAQAQTPKFDLTQIPEIAPPSASDILARARGEFGVQIAEEEAKLGKEQLSAALPGQLSDVRANFASRGLVFSGARTKTEQAVRDKNLADQLQIDLRFAKVLGNAIDKASTEMGKEIEEIVEGAQAKQKAEVDFLEKIGLAVDPRTGELFPTLAATREARQQETAEARAELNQAKLELSQAKLDLQTTKSQADLDLALVRLEQAQQRLDQSGNDKILSSVDIQRYREMYPTAGIAPGDTQGDAELKVQRSIFNGLVEDIEAGVENGDIQTADDAVKVLKGGYPELDDAQIKEIAGEMIVTSPESGEKVSLDTAFFQGFRNIMGTVFFPEQLKREQEDRLRAEQQQQ